MRFMVIVKSNADTEAGIMPTEAQLAEMGAYNEQLVDAGVMLAGEGLHPTSKGAIVTFDETGRASVTDGPFAEAKEIVGGFWIWEVGSKDEAIEWLRRAPFKNDSLELRQVFAAEDFGAEFTPELQAQEERLREKVAEQHG